MHRGQAAFTVVFKHREVNNPQRCPFGFVGQAEVFAQLQTQRAHRIGNHFLVVCAEEDHVAILRAGALKDRFHDVRIQELRNRAGDPFQTFRTLGYFNIGQTFRAVDLNEVAVIVDLLTAQCRTARYAQGCNTAFRIVSRAGEYRELNGFHQVCNIHQLHRVTQVWFVGTVTTLGFGEGHDREIAQLDAFHVIPQATHQRFHHFTHLLGGHEGGFHIDLGEFWLTVSTQVFVAETFDYLIVAIETGHHQQLFEQLWRLWQRVEFAFMYAGWDQIIARTFRCGFGQHRGFDIEETVVIHETAHQAGDFRTGFQALGHLRTTQIQVAVFQTRFFRVDVVGVQRQRFSTVNDNQIGRQYFNGTRRHVCVDVFLVTRTHGTGDLNAELITQLRSQLQRIRTIRVEEHLNDTFTVAHIDENKATKITTTVDPTTQGDLLSDVGLTQLPAIFCTHEISLN